MDLDRFAALRQRLTVDITPDNARTAQTLHQVDAALSVLSDANEIVVDAAQDLLFDLPGVAPIETPDIPDDELIKSALESLGEDVDALLRQDGVTLIRRPTGTRMFLDTVDQNVLQNVAPTFLFEPLRDRFGREFDIGILTPAVRLAVLPSPGAAPVMLFTSARKPRSGAQRITITGGTIWVAASLLDPSAGADGYVGLRVTGGRLTLQDGVSVSGDDVILGGPLAGALTFQPDPSPIATARVNTAAPEDFRIVFASGSATAAEFSNGAAKADGVSLEFRAIGDMRHDDVHDQIIFDCEVGPEPIDTADFAFETAKMTGQTGLGKGGFAIPVTRTAAPRSLPEAAGQYAWVSLFTDSVKVTWRGGPASEARLDDARLAIGPDCFTISTAEAHPGVAGDAHDFRLWRLPGSAHHAKISIGLTTPFPATFGCGADGGDLIRFTGLFDDVFDRPVDARGGPIPMVSEPVIVQITGPADYQNVGITLADPARDIPPRRNMMTIENAYLSVNTNRLALLLGKLAQGTDVFDAAVATLVPVMGWIPTLPDPYVDNLSVGENDLLRRETLTTLLGVFRWETGAAEFGFLGQLSRATSGKAPPSRGRPRPAPQNDLNPPYRGQTEQGAVIPQRGRFDFPLASAALPPQTPTGDPADATQEAIGNFSADLKRLGIDRGGCMLLDVSTARDQIGVQIEERQSSIAGGGMFVLGLRMGAPLAALRVFALPQIQWEPVRTLPKDQDPITLGIFPTPLASADDGGATVLASNAAVLAAAIPEITLDHQIAELSTGDPLNVVSTLPFGMRMLVKLRPPGPLEDAVEIIRPVFPTERPLEGGIQVSMRSEVNVSRNVDSQSAAFEGRTVQFPNGVALDTGAPLNISVLGATVGNEGSVETLFNQEFGGANARVPLTRYDISGYGASTFSDWKNPKGSFAETTRANFQVVVGRTLLEIVKVASVLYPWGIRVTRSVTIERRGGGGVVRRDSGWQAQSPGLFDFTTDTVPAQPYEIHPGLIRGIHDIDRIRPAGEELTLPGTGRVLPMAFDANVTIDGAPERTRAEGLIGFLHLAHQTPLPPGPGQPLSPADLAALVLYQGGIGGPVDTEINVGGSGFRARATRIEVALAERAGQPVFVGAVRTMPIFGTAGSWSVVSGPGPSVGGGGDIAAATDGAPILREGIAQPASGNTVNAPGVGRYRIRDAADLFRGGNPEVEYGLLQADTTHRFLFQRPEIAPGQPRIVSDLPPAFVDFYAASSSKALFPTLGNAIALIDENYWLNVESETGYLSLSRDVEFQAPRGDLLLSETSADSLRISYDNSELRFQLGTDSWNMEFPGLELWTDTEDLPNLSGSRVTVRGGTGQSAELDEIETLMSPIVENLLSAMPLLDQREKVGPIDLGVSNLKVTPKISYGFDTFFPKGAPVAIRLFALGEIGIENELGVSDEALFIGSKAGFEARISIPLGGFPVAVLFGFGLSLGGKALLTGPDAGKAKGIIEARLYIGLAFGKKLAAFEAVVASGIGLLFLRGSETGMGGFVFLEIKIDIKPIVQVKVSGEFACLQVEKSGGKKVQRWTGTVGINVSIFMLISIKFTADVSDEKEVE
ncbi:hypothetical protein [Cognatiyoonia sp. IB215182]|uniref:hypothetical protein n=1 Tax=Cognatiyoonia sp. IB215182 TaxID=3097353 RepID=UPI002A169367|nr:hypothetical protein [Cognatiyoonia sp. IB215182]MDX8354135.1 hypothetical protein [Cognatiyoonia sp. IB215182]